MGPRARTHGRGGGPGASRSPGGAHRAGAQARTAVAGPGKPHPIAPRWGRDNSCTALTMTPSLLLHCFHFFNSDLPCFCASLSYSYMKAPQTFYDQDATMPLWDPGQATTMMRLGMWWLSLHD